MFSFFPTLLSFQQISPLLLRLTLGIIFLYWAYKGFVKKDNKRGTALCILDFILGILFVIGLFTQLSAMIACVVLLIANIYKIKTGSFFTDGINYYFILFIISISLLITGPGLYSFDLPL